MKRDWEGEHSYVGEEGSSVLDLIIEIKTERGSTINELRVEPTIESDHLPIEIYKKKQKREGGKRQ